MKKIPRIIILSSSRKDLTDLLKEVERSYTKDCIGIILRENDTKEDVLFQLNGALSPGIDFDISDLWGSDDMHYT